MRKTWVLTGAAVLGNGAETLVSWLASLVSCGVHFALLLAFTGAAWVLACECIAFAGFWHVRWVRWGLDGKHE